MNEVLTSGTLLYNTWNKKKRHKQGQNKYISKTKYCSKICVITNWPTAMLLYNTWNKKNCHKGVQKYYVTKQPILQSLTDFLSLQPAVSSHHSNQFLNDAWGKKKKHKTAEQKEVIQQTSVSCLQPAVNRQHRNLFLHNAWYKTKRHKTLEQKVDKRWRTGLWCKKKKHKTVEQKEDKRWSTDFLSPHHKKLYRISWPHNHKLVMLPLCWIDSYLWLLSREYKIDN